MRIGVLSDTHDQAANLVRALDRCRQEGVTTVIHCGDLTNARLVTHMAGFTVHYVTGNVDRDAAAIRRALRDAGPENTCGPVFRATLDGVAVAATHGHLVDELDRLLADKSVPYVFHGHTHRRRDERGAAGRVINPGALGGVRYEPRTFCLLDLATGDAEFVDVADW